MKKTSFRIFVVCLIASLLICVGFLIVSFKFDNNKKISVKQVENPIMFFTVESCVNKYINLIIAQDSEALYNVIDSKYKKENEITIDNVLSVNKYLNGNYSFIATSMLEDKEEKNKYYVKGYLIAESMNTEYFSNEKIEYSLIVKLDINNYTYSVILDEVGEYFEQVWFNKTNYNLCNYHGIFCNWYSYYEKIFC